MYTHAPSDYICPICLGVRGIESEQTLLKSADKIYDDDLVCAFINSFWVGTNEGHVIVVPKTHFENIYELPDVVGSRIFSVAKKVARTMKSVYGCAGVTLRQNNEPASEQHAFHYHLHVFPRYVGDDFNIHLTEKSRLADPLERAVYAEKLRARLEKEIEA